jgi:hypothetical protein
MEPIREALRQVLEDLTHKKSCGGRVAVHERFSAILTENERPHAQAVYYRKGILGVTVESPHWLYYFSMRKKKLIEAMTAHVSDIGDMRFTVGKLQ